MEKEGVIMPVIDVNLSYKTPALFDDKIIVEVRLNEIPKVKMKFSYSIKNQNDQIVCLGAFKWNTATFLADDLII